MFNVYLYKASVTLNEPNPLERYALANEAAKETWTLIYSGNNTSALSPAIEANEIETSVYGSVNFDFVVYPSKNENFRNFVAEVDNKWSPLVRCVVLNVITNEIIFFGFMSNVHKNRNIEGGKYDFTFTSIIGLAYFSDRVTNMAVGTPKDYLQRIIDNLRYSSSTFVKGNISFNPTAANMQEVNDAIIVTTDMESIGRIIDELEKYYEKNFYCEYSLVNNKIQSKLHWGVPESTEEILTIQTGINAEEINDVIDSNRLATKFGVRGGNTAILENTAYVNDRAAMLDYGTVYAFERKNDIMTKKALESYGRGELNKRKAIRHIVTASFVDIDETLIKAPQMSFVGKNVRTIDSELQINSAHKLLSITWYFASLKTPKLKLSELEQNLYNY